MIDVSATVELPDVVVYVEALERRGKSRARAVIVHINSPGGTTSGSEQIGRAHV